MKTVVFAYHDMGCLGIEALLAAGYEISAIFTHTDNPGEKAFYGSVARLAAERGIPVYAPDNVNHPLWVERIAQLSPEVIFSFYYRHLICDEILQLAPAGAFNLHGSLLPKYRGRAPLNWVLVNGETETGVTLHRMVKRADAGAIVAQLRIAIAPDDIAITLHHKLCHAARQLLEQTLPAIKHGNILEIAQRENEATCFGRRTPDDSFLEWHKPASVLHNMVRAVADPWPGAFSYVGNQKFTDDFLYQAEWLQYRKNGLLNKVSTAWSRQGQEKVYVQHKLRENAADVWQWLQNGAHVYVCGDALKMAKDVEQALLDIIAEHGNMSPDDADEYLSELRENKRYQRDVY